MDAGNHVELGHQPIRNDALSEVSPQQRPVKSEVRSRVNNPKPTQYIATPSDNAGRRATTALRKSLDPQSAPQTLLNALLSKRKDLVTEQRKYTDRDPKFHGLADEIKKLDDQLTIVKGEMREISSLKKEGSPAEAAKIEKRLHKQLIALDEPKLSKWGKVANFIAGFILGLGIAAVLTLSLSNPIGLAIFGLGAFAVAGVMIYQKRQGVDFKKSALSAGIGVVAGLSFGFAGGTSLIAATAAAAKGSAISSAITGHGSTALTSMHSTYTAHKPWFVGAGGTVLTFLYLGMKHCGSSRKK